MTVFVTFLSGNLTSGKRKETFDEPACKKMAWTNSYDPTSPLRMKTKEVITVLNICFHPYDDAMCDYCSNRKPSELDGRYDFLYTIVLLCSVNTTILYIIMLYYSVNTT